jgi:predicted lactoylglutathione lyase
MDQPESDARKVFCFAARSGRRSDIDSLLGSDGFVGGFMQFPSVCPEIPVSSLPPALAYYRDQLGFNIDWSDEQLGLACLSRGDTRMFMTNAEYRSVLGIQGPMVLWLNLSNRAEVDALHAQWAAAGARIADPPETKPYNKLYEFFAQDIDGNYFRVFYDTAWEERGDARL